MSIFGALGTSPSSSTRFTTTAVAFKATAVVVLVLYRNEEVFIKIETISVEYINKPTLQI